MKKLSARQQEVIDLLSNGWELGWGLDIGGTCWIQKGGAGRGGESRKVSIATARALREAGKVVCVENKFPTARYRVSPTVELGDAEIRGSAAILAMYCQDKDRQCALQQTMILTLRKALSEYSTDRHPSGIAAESTCWADKALVDTMPNVI